MAKGKSSGRDAYSSQYKSSGREAKNKEMRILRAIKKNPENESFLLQQLAQINKSHGRGTPKAHVWSATMVREAKLFKEFTGSASIDLWSSNPKTQAKARQLTGKKQLLSPKQLKNLGQVDFSIAARCSLDLGRWGN